MDKNNALTKPNSHRQPQINEYWENGYKVTEMIFPDSNTYMVTKEKENTVFYYYRTDNTSMKGQYDKSEYEKRRQAFDKQMEEWYAKCRDWDKEIDERLNTYFGKGSSLTFPDLPDFPEFPEFSDTLDFFSTSFEGVNTQSSTYKQSKSSSNISHKKQSSKSGNIGCFGCLVWTILILCLICIILYGMGVIGANLINIITNFFKSLF